MEKKKSMSSADRLCLVWAIVVVIFFSLSKSKLPGYILTVTVACGILTARFFERALANPGSKAARIVGRAGITLAVLSVLVAAAAIFLSEHMNLLVKPLRIPVAEAEELGRHFITAVVLLLVFAVLGFLVRFRRDAALGLAVFAVFPLLLFTLNYAAIETVFKFKSARELSRKDSAVATRNRAGFLRMLSKRALVLFGPHRHVVHQGRP